MSVQQKKLECSWDADVIEFWNASLKSYKTCHETNEQCTDSEKVTADLIKSLPPKVVSELANNNKRKIDQVDQKEGELKKAEEQEILYREQRAAEHDEEARYNGMKEELYRQSEDAYVKGDQYNRSQEEQYNALEEEQYNEVEEEQYNEVEEQYNEVEEQYNEVEEQYNDLENDQEPSSKKAKYTEEPQYQQSYQQPPMPPMPPMPTNDDGLSNMIMAWYYAGYYTGLYQAGRQ